jgi:hypothetical protein
MTTQRLVIRDWLPPPVANTSRQRHWATVRKEVEAVKIMVWASAKHAGWQPVKGRARITVVFVHAVKRRRDHDNTTARAKHLIDGLKPWIVDDSEEWLDLPVVRNDVRRGERATEITLESL